MEPSFRVEYFSPQLRAPHSEAMGDGLFELPKRELAIARQRLKEVKRHG